MAANLVVPPKFRALDANGNPLAGGLLYSYEAGTSTPLATYTARAGTVANANPVVLDANGEANVWLEEGSDYKLELRNSLGVVQWTTDNIPSPASADATTEAATDPGGRLTLTTATPVTTTDVTAASTVYYVPYKSNKVPLYDGSAWAVHTVETELSQTISDNTKSPAASVAGGLYDVFVWDDDGTLRATRGPAWSAPGVRGTGAGTTELERVDGRYVNKVSISNGPAAQCGLYVGTVFMDVSGNTANDSLTKRHVWNMYNRMLRPMKKLEATNSWGYGSSPYRQARADATNQLDVVIGLSEDAVRVRLTVACSSGAGDTVGASAVGIGLDSVTTTVAAASFRADGTGGSANYGTISAEYSDFPGIGRHYFTWMEHGDGAVVMIFIGDDGGDISSGLKGEVLG